MGIVLGITIMPILAKINLATANGESEAGMAVHTQAALDVIFGKDLLDLRSDLVLAFLIHVCHGVYSLLYVAIIA
jgi:hypothetical protein